VTDDFEVRLQQAGYRRTGPRREVWEAVTRLRHATPEQIVADLDDVDTSTVYRALEVLVQVGLITHTHIGHGPPVYHAVDPTPHLHLVCQRCGAQSSAPITTAQSLVAALMRDHGFAADVDYMSLPGLCAACREATPDPDA
jgi:Fur family transcriptional regulator, ferric uptake regulator